ncbi:OmpA family protein [Kaarinaea lacus]
MRVDIKDKTMRSGIFRKSLLPLVCAITVSGCVSQGTYNELAQEHDKLKMENEQLAKQNRALQGNIKLSRNRETLTEQEREQLKQELTITNEALVATTQGAMAVTTLYDKLVKDLAGEVANQQVTIEQMQSGVNVNLPAEVLFESGSADVSTEGKVVLHKVALELKDVPFQTIVGGFTDNVAISKRLATQFPSNWDLAAARATQVVRLLEESGVPGEQLVAVSFGENQPIADNDNPEGRAQNRRIEIRLRPVVVE